MGPIKFLPWEPAGHDPRIDGVRLLLLGESHYEEEPAADDVFEVSPTYTRRIVRRYGVHPKKRQVFFANLYTAMTGEPWSLDADTRRFWDSVFFYNYIPTLVPKGPRNPPSPEMWADAVGPFFTVLERIKPEAILVLGARLWGNMTKERGGGEPGRKLGPHLELRSIGRRQRLCGQYQSSIVAGLFSSQVATENRQLSCVGPRSTHWTLSVAVHPALIFAQPYT